MNRTLLDVERRLRDDFGLDRARDLVRRVAADLGETPATYWLLAFVGLLEFKRANGENAVRFARWAYSRPSAVRLLRWDAERLDALAPALESWAALRTWMEPSLSADPRKRARRRARILSGADSPGADSPGA